ncbi:MAG TPA: LysR substrate-binding domain-containing protein [Pararobbsia sp.]|nr:LysR substrate-binding domain-containing protein [Pararobbsia sp.]
MRRLPPLQTLLAFESAARLASFSRAAQELSLTQSAVSHQIQQLEAWAGQMLFRRVGRGVALTAAGQVFARTVDETIRLLTDGRNRIEPYCNPDSVILYCPPAFASGIVVPALDALRIEHPSLELWLVTTEQAGEIDHIDVDLIVSDRLIRSPDVVGEVLLEAHSIAICGLATAGRLRDMPFPEVLSQAPLIMHERDPDWAPWLADYRRDGLPIRRAITIDDPRLIVDAVQREVGIAMVPALWARAALAEGRVAVLTQVPVVPQPRLWLMRSTQPPRAPAVVTIDAWLRALCAAYSTSDSTRHADA